MLTDLLYRVRTILRRKAVETELADELGFHLQQQVQWNMRAGMDPDEALRQARLSLSGVEQLKEECRDARGTRLWDATTQDLKYALRQLRRSPGYSVAAVLTIGLGIGSATALFTVANALMLRPLPVQNPEALVTIARDAAQPSLLHSYADYLLTRDQVRGAFTGVAAFNNGNAVGFSTLNSDRETPVLASTAFVSSNYFEVLGVGSSLGRVLGGADENPSGTSPPVILSYEFWQRRMGGSADVPGRTVRLNSAICTVVGVAREGFAGTVAGSPPDVYVPLSSFPSILPMMRRNWNAPRRQWLIFIGRLQPGVSVPQAAAQIDALGEASQRQARTSLLPLQHGLGPASALAEPLLVLLAAAGLFLALACANVAGLVLARSLQRQREIAVRLALGAGRPRLVRQFLTESLLLASLGGAAGLAAGLAGARLLLHFLPSDGPLPFALDVSPDVRVFGFAFAVTLITGLLFGVGPALRAARGDVAGAIKNSPRTRTGWLRMDPRRALVVTQVSLSMVLLVGVALLGRSLAHLHSLDLGYARSGLLFVYVQPSQVGYEGRRAREFYERFEERVATLPGVTRTALADFAPLDGGNDSGLVTVAGRPAPVSVETNTVSEHYLDALSIPLLAGRNLTRQDAAAGAPPVTLVNEQLAHILFPDQTPIGRSVTYADQSGNRETWQIVGVVRDARYFSLRESSVPMLYTPLDPALSRLVLCVRATTAPGQLIPLVRREAAALDPAVPVLETATIDERLNRENAAPRLLGMLLSSFGLMALLLAGIGLHGVLACGVAARTREIGVRMALGAGRASVVRRILGEVWKLVGVGCVAGMLASLAAVRLVAGFLFGVRPVDPASYLAVLGVIALAAAAASYVPARRAANIDPSEALRHD